MCWQAKSLLGNVIGLQVIYLVWGVLQERIMTQDYDGEYFRGSQFLVFGNRVFALVVAMLLVIFRKQVRRDNDACQSPSIK